MKKTDIAMIILIAGLGVGIGYLGVEYIVFESSGKRR